MCHLKEKAVHTNQVSSPMCTHLSLRGGDWGTPCSANQTTLPQPAPLCRCCRLIPLPLSELTDVISPIPGLDCTACQVAMCRVRRTSRRQELTQRPPSSQERKHTKKWVPVATNPPRRSTGDSGGGGEGGEVGGTGVGRGTRLT